MIKNDRFLKKMTKFSKKLADCACDFEKKDEIFQKSIRTTMRVDVVETWLIVRFESS